MRTAIVVFTLFALGSPTLAAAPALQLVLPLPTNAQQVVTPYSCDGLEPFSVTYINAAPTFLAFLPIDGETQIFVNVLAASGARYVSGKYEWWTKGAEATLTDLTAPEGTKPAACIEAGDTP